MSKKDKKVEDFKKESTDKLHQEILNSKKELLSLRFQAKMSELNDTSMFKKNRNKIARIQTELNRRKLSGDK